MVTYVEVEEEVGGGGDFQSRFSKLRQIEAKYGQWISNKWILYF